MNKNTVVYQFSKFLNFCVNKKLHNWFNLMILISWDKRYFRVCERRKEINGWEKMENNSSIAEEEIWLLQPESSIDGFETFFRDEKVPNFSIQWYQNNEFILNFIKNWWIWKPYSENWWVRPNPSNSCQLRSCKCYSVTWAKKYIS